MAYSLRVRCSDCESEWYVDPQDITLHLWRPSDAGRPWYTFVCAGCEQEQVKKVNNPRVYEMLTEAQCPIEYHAVSPDLLEEHKGDEISYDDLIDLHFALRDDTRDWTKELNLDD